MKTSHNPELQVGRNYRVVRDLACNTGTFQTGQILRLESSNYSRYDGSTLFIFRDNVTGELKGWCLGDNEPPVECPFLEIGDDTLQSPQRS
jgi:hypothetical protein